MSQQRALDRLAALPEDMIRGEHARQLFAEHNIHLHEEDPWEAGEVGDDHMTGDTGRSIHHDAATPLHTSQDYLWRPTLEHFVRHPYEPGQSDGGPRSERPSTWSHEGRHWINGGHHRILADRMAAGRGTEVSERTRTAAREPGSTDCWVCGGSGMDNAEGMECGACDGSGYLTPGEQRRWTCPEGMRITKDPSDGWQHADGSIGCDDTTGATVGDVVCARTQALLDRKYRIRGWAAREYPPRRHENGGVPFKRIFGPTYGLDERLFDRDKLKPAIRDDLMRKWHEFCDTFGLYDPDNWSIVYFAGSEASEWTSENLRGNNDFDVLVGVSLPLFLNDDGYGEHLRERAVALGWAPDGALTQESLAAGLTQKLREAPGMVDPAYRLPGSLDDGSEFDQTWYVNPGSYRIADIKPYAAYDVTHDDWAVKPPHLPGWSIRDFPEGPALEQYCWGVEDAVRATLDMPSPYSHQEAFALYEFLHSQRSGAFGPQGEGWYDTRNVIEKWLDQKGLWAQLYRLRTEAVDNPHLLDSPADWTNTPHMAMLVRSVLGSSVAPAAGCR